MQHTSFAILPSGRRLATGMLLFLLSPAGSFACTMSRSAPNEITLRFDGDCIRDAGGQSRLQGDLTQAVFDLNALYEPAAGDTVPKAARSAPTAASKRRDQTFTPTQRKLYALDQVEYDRATWWAKTFMPLRYYGQKKAP